MSLDTAVKYDEHGCICCLLLPAVAGRACLASIILAKLIKRWSGQLASSSVTSHSPYAEFHTLTHTFSTASLWLARCARACAQSCSGAARWPVPSPDRLACMLDGSTVNRRAAQGV